MPSPQDWIVDYCNEYKSGTCLRENRTNMQMILRKMFKLVEFIWSITPCTSFHDHSNDPFQQERSCLVPHAQWGEMDRTWLIKSWTFFYSEQVVHNEFLLSFSHFCTFNFTFPTCTVVHWYMVELSHFMCQKMLQKKGGGGGFNSSTVKFNGLLSTKNIRLTESWDR